MSFPLSPTSLQHFQGSSTTLEHLRTFYSAGTIVSVDHLGLKIFVKIILEFSDYSLCMMQIVIFHLDPCYSFSFPNPLFSPSFLFSSFYFSFSFLFFFIAMELAFCSLFFPPSFFFFFFLSFLLFAFLAFPFVHLLTYGIFVYFCCYFSLVFTQKTKSSHFSFPVKSYICKDEFGYWS